MEFVQKLLFVPLTCVCMNVSAQRPSYSDALHRTTTKECFNLLATYQDYWVADSLCTNGFREIFAWEFITRFDSLVGSPWADLHQYLGKPDQIIKNTDLVRNPTPDILNKGEVLYRYILTPNAKKGNTYKAPGVRLLHIRVLDGKIVRVSGKENDG